MQCGEILCQKVPIMTQGTDVGDSNMPKKTEKESIHSGHFMVSDFNAEAQDDEFEVAVPVPVQAGTESTFTVNNCKKEETQLSIETSLNKLFQCMSLAYRQKLTSPKWNRFKGIRLRWKDKIRLNNVIWRCWHMQFIMKQNTLVCQFASPLDVDTHNKPEAVVLEGKYWKRKLAAVTAEYKKWRMFYRNRIMGWPSKDGSESDMLTDMDMFDWQPHSNESVMGGMMVDEDYMEFMSDTLFSTITANQPFAFPDTREIARGVSIADFIQPSLVQLQPNLDDFMDTLEPLQDLLCSKLPSVPEESVADSMFRNVCGANNYQAMLMSSSASNSVQSQPPALMNQRRQQQNLQYTATIFAQSEPTANFQTASNTAQRSDDYAQGSVPSSYQEVPMLRSPGKSLSALSPAQRGVRSSAPGAGTYSAQPGPRQMPPFQGYDAVPSTSHVPSRTQLPYPSPTAPAQQGFKFPPATYRYTPAPAQGYKNFRLPSPPPLSEASGAGPGAVAKPPRSNSLPGPENEMFALPKYNKLTKRNRSRSGPLHVPSSSGQRQIPPPLLTAASDPSLPTINSMQPLLAQLLTNNPVVYNFGATDKMPPSSGQLKSSSVVPILPMPSRTQLPQTSTALLITTTPVTLSQQASLPSRQLYPGALGSPNKPPADSPSDGSSVSSSLFALSPLSSPKPVESPGSPSKPGSSKNDTDGSSKSTGVRPRRSETPAIQENWRHIMAEQKRRCNIKNGFDMLHKLIPSLHQNPNVKLSKAAMLQKGADYIRQLQSERVQLRDEMDNLRQQVECLNASISNCQSLLPATGAPVSRQRSSKMREMFDDYVRRRTLENWRFWIFSILIEPLLVSYTASVSTANLDDLYRSTLLWTEQHCSLVDLRPAVLNSLRYLCTSTDILSDPSKLPEEARKATSKTERHAQ